MNRDPIADLALLHPAATDQRSAGLRHLISTLTFSPDSHLLAAVSDDGITRVWTVDNDGAFTPHAILQGHNGTTTTASFEPTGTHLVTTGTDGTVRRWDLDTDRALARGCTAAATSDPSRWLPRDTTLLDGNGC